MRRVLVLNHFAGATAASVGTRHVEMFSRLGGWSYLIAVASHSAVDAPVNRSSVGYLALPSLPFSGNGFDRVANWMSYSASCLTHLAAGHRPDVVYASSPHLLTGLAGLILARRWRARFVLEIRDLWPQVLVDMGQMEASSPIYRALEKLEARLYAEADRIVVLAEGTRNHLAEQGVRKSKIELIPNAADPSDFNVVRSREDLRSDFGFTRFTCVYAGAHGPANGLHLLIDAAEGLSDASVDFVLVGNGPAKPELIRRVHAGGLQNVRFLEPIPKSQMPNLLAAADVGLHVLADVPLFRYGISPNKVFDYLAAGLPMITNVPGKIGQLVADSRGGIAVAPAGLADGIRQMAYASPELLASMGNAGRAFMRTHQSRSAMVLRLQSLLDGLEPFGG